MKDFVIVHPVTDVNTDKLEEGEVSFGVSYGQRKSE